MLLDGLLCAVTLLLVSIEQERKKGCPCAVTLSGRRQAGKSKGCSVGRAGSLYCKGLVEEV